MSIADPREETVEVERGQVYESNKGERYQVLLENDEIVLLRGDSPTRENDDYSHRLERRIHFEQCVREEQFEYKPESDLDMIEDRTIEWSEVDYIGEQTEKNLHGEGYETALDIEKADDNELMDVDGLGGIGLTNLREFVR